MLASRAPYWLGESGRAGDEVFNVRSTPAGPTLSYAMRTLRVVTSLLPDESEFDPRPKLALDDIERGWAASYWGRGWARSLRILVEISADSLERRWPADAAVAHIAAAFRRTLVSLHPAATETRSPLMANGCRLFSSRPDTLLPISLERVTDALDTVLDDVRVGSAAVARGA